MEYKKDPFTLEERKIIENGIREQITNAEIGRMINRNKESIKNEIKNRGGREFYNAEKAHEMATKKPLSGNKPSKPSVHYKYSERQTIEGGLKSLLSYIEIGRLLDRSWHSIKNEVLKNGGKKNYNALQAQNRHEDNLFKKTLKLRTQITPEEEAIIIQGFTEGWSRHKIQTESAIGKMRLDRWMNENPDIVKENRRNFVTMEDRIKALEMQIDIIFDLIKGKK